MVNYPSSLDVLSNPAGTDPTTGALLHSVQHANANDILEALEAKLGIGASTPGASGVLRVTSAGVSGWGQVVAADITAQTITGAAVGAGMNIGVQTIYGGQSGLSNIALASIATGDLVANAITQSAIAIGSTSSPTSSATAFADVPEMTVPLTTVGGDVLVWFACSVAHTNAAATVAAAIRADSGVDAGALEFTVSNANHIRPLVCFSRISGLSAGVHNFRGRAKNDVGATLTYQGIARYILAVELKK